MVSFSWSMHIIENSPTTWKNMLISSSSSKSLQFLTFSGKDGLYFMWSSYVNLGGKRRNKHARRDNKGVGKLVFHSWNIRNTEIIERVLDSPYLIYVGLQPWILSLESFIYLLNNEVCIRKHFQAFDTHFFSSAQAQNQSFVLCDVVHELKG